MNEGQQTSPASFQAPNLEAQLEAARKEKLLAQVPALRRLRTVVRIFIVFAVVAQIFVVTSALGLRPQQALVAAAGLGVVSATAFWVFAAAGCLSMAISWLQLAYYFRYLKQFKKVQISALLDTISVLRELIIFSLIISFVTAAAVVAMYQNMMVLAALAGGLLLGVLFQLVVLHYVKTAQAEVPALAAAVGEGGASEHYAPRNSLFLRALVAAVVVTAVGYLLGTLMPSVEPTGFGQVLTR